MSIFAGLFESGSIFFQVSPEIFDIVGGFDSQSRQSQKSGFPSGFRDRCGMVKHIKKKLSVPFRSHSAIFAQRFGDIHRAMNSADDAEGKTEHRESDKCITLPNVECRTAKNFG